MQNRRMKWQRKPALAAAVVVIALVSAATLGARRFLASENPGTLVVNTTPAGATVIIDGQRRGSSPVTVELMPGSHTLTVTANDQTRTIPVTITEGGQVAQFIEIPTAAPESGTLQVRSEPPGATVIVDGQPRGTAPLTIFNLTPGDHTVRLENPTSAVTEQVTIEAGASAALVVPLGPASTAAVSGWISVAAPVEVQIYENQRLVGSSRSDRIMVPVGRHELEIVEESLGYRASRIVQVTPGNVSIVRLDWPRGSMALNATPWAEVWIDGERMGETPIGNIQVPIGPHEVVFRHPELGQQTHRVVVPLNAPARVSADLRTR